MAHTPAGEPDNNNDTLASVCGVAETGYGLRKTQGTEIRQ